MNYEYQDVTLSATFLTKEGEPVTLMKNGLQSLTLTVSKNK